MVSILMRISEKYIRGNMVMFCANYAACMVVSLIYMGLIALTLARRKRQRITADLLCGLLIGISNYYSARFLPLSLGSVPTVVAYPVFSVGTIIVISTAGALFFHERLSRHKKGALLLILTSSVMLNI